MNTHLLPVPYEIAELINSFAYYDRTSWKYIQQVRGFKLRLCNQMLWCPCNPMDVDTHWAMWLDTVEIQFQALFCKKCGNYLSDNYVRCNCLFALS